jgi:hypothetical protein
VLSPPQSPHRSHQFKELDLRLLQQCTSSWALEPRLHRLVADYNRAGSEASLVEFSKSRSGFLRHLLAYLNDFWAVITGMAKTLLVERVHRVSSSQAKASVDFVLRSKASFRDVHENKNITLWTFNEHKGAIALTSLSLVDFWLKSANRRTRAAVVFNPRAHSAAVSSTAASNFNLWRGFLISQDVASAAGAGMDAAQLKSAIQPFLDHVRDIWCRDDADAYVYCLSWMASLVQRPWRKLGVAIVLQGQPGSGKGSIVTEILAKVIGPHHFSHVTGLDQICGQFNAPALATACLVFVDEAMCGSNKQHAAKLKTLITESRHTVENKYVPALSAESFANYILSSNEDHVVAIEHKDRRYFALQTDNRFSGSQTAERKAYFDQLLAVSVELVAKYLYQFDITEFNPRQVPITDLQRAQKLLTLQTAGVDTWLLRCIEKGALPQHSGEMDVGAAFRWEAARLKAAVYDHYHAQAGAHPKPGEDKTIEAVCMVRSTTMDWGATPCGPKLQVSR